MRPLNEKDAQYIFKSGKIEGTQATFHSIRGYFGVRAFEVYTYADVMQILTELEECFLKALEKK